MPELLLLHDIAHLIGRAQSLQEILDGVVALVAERMRADVCSIYLLDAPGETLTLAATRGLRPSAVGHARLERGQGVTWQILDRMGPLIIEDAPTDKHFVYLPEVGEDELHALLGVPLRARHMPIGTLAIQMNEPREFTQDEVRALSAIASQIAPVVDNSRLLSLAADDVTQDLGGFDAHSVRRACGTSCSVGVVAGTVAKPLGSNAVAARSSMGPKRERLRLRVAMKAAREELLEMQQWLRDRHADEAALLFSAQLMMLDDNSFLSRIDDAIENGMEAAAAAETVLEHLLARFDRMHDEYLRERGADVSDLASRLQRHLDRDPSEDSEQRDAESGDNVRDKVVVLFDLTPSRLVTLCAEGAAAVLAGGGSATSHAALLARSLDLPLVVGLGDFVHTVRDGERVLVDAATGEVVVDPPASLVMETIRTAKAGADALHRLAREHPADSGRIRYEANVSLWGDAVRANELGASGVGLYRTEFAFLMRPDLPSTEEQAELYRRIVDEIAPMPVTFRLLDAGGDKLVPALGQAPEPNPFLGYRSTRLLLDHPEVLRDQVRAILDALDGREGRVLVPMIASIEEFRAVRTLLEDADLLPPQLGAMVELPSALLGVDVLAREADFLSIGTNDLTQHLLGVDRTNARVTRYFDFCHPSVLRGVEMTVAAARAHGKEVCVCGEMASDPLFLPVWVALGVGRLAAHARRIAPLRALEAQFDREESEALVRDILAMDSRYDIRSRLESVAAPEVLDYMHGSILA
ncbi:MAG: phosphoenolpyruvate--protein phosphotransferase [Planctomycetota bacterium]